MAGFFRSNLRTSAGGVEKLAFSFSRDVLEPQDVLDPRLSIAIAVHELPPVPDLPIPALPDGHRMWVIPGFVNLNVIDGVRGLWNKLPQLLGALGDGGIDVIIDLGRLGVDDIRLPILDAADRVLLCSTSSMIDLNRAYRRLALPDLNHRIRGLTDSDRYWTLLSTASAEPIPNKDFATHIRPVIASLPFDPVGAGVFSHGRPDPKPTKNAYRSAIRRAVQDLHALADRVQDRSISA